MSEYGIKVSKSGQDVNSAPTEDLQLYSNNHTQIVKFQGNLSLNTNPYKDPDNPGDFVDYQFTIAHNLGYVPGFMVYGINNDSDNMFLKSAFAPHGEIGVDCVADETNLYVNLYMAVWSMTTNLWIGYYYIFANQT